MLLEEVDAKAVKASSLNKLGTPASWSVYLRCGVGSRTILCLGSSARVNRGGTQHHLVSRASKVHQVYFSAAPGPSSGWRPGKLGGPEPHLSYLNPSSVVGSTKAPSFPLQCSPSLSGNSSSFPVPRPPLRSGIAPVLLSCLMKVQVFWIYDARAEGVVGVSSER